MILTELGMRSLLGATGKDTPGGGRLPPLVVEENTMAAARVPQSVKIDLSHLPKDVQEAVGSELALSIAKNMKLTSKPVLIGRLDPGIYGYIQPSAALLKQLKGR